MTTKPPAQGLFSQTEFALYKSNPVCLTEAAENKLFNIPHLDIPQITQNTHKILFITSIFKDQTN